MSITTTPQKAKVYAIFDNPPAVFSCQVNQTFATHDKIFEFTYDGATGTYTNILPGMTILLGSTAGAYDKGITYCRKAPTSTKIFCGETSEVAWADNLYVTALQDWAIWNEYLRIATNGTVYMKYDVAYSNQHSKMKPIPILGPDRVVFIAYPSVSISFDGSYSFVPGSTISSHAFSCSGGSITGASTATPTITFISTGRYVVTYTVTSAQGVSSTTYRIIHVVSLGTSEDYVIDTREWHAAADFSGTQGQRNWRYQYLSGGVYADLNTYSSSNWTLSPVGFPVIGSTLMHPSNTGQSAVRTWVAPDTMTVRLSATVTKVGNGGDGVVANLKHNSDLLWTHIFGATAGETSSYDITIDVAAGDKIYHIVDPRTNYASDSTNWAPNIVGSRVLAPAIDPFGISEVISGSLAGDFEIGGWSFEVAVLSNATSIRERTKVILFSDEWYGNTKVSYGPLAGAENIIAIGWVSNEKITIDAEQSQIAVNVQGTQYWLQKIYSFVPHGIERSGGVPTAWTQMNPVTVDKVLWNLFMWRSTVINCVDVYLTGDTRQAAELTATSNSVWEQVKEIAYTSILATPCCDRYGRMIVQIEASLLPGASRSSISNTATITHDDCESIDVERILVTPASQVVLSGMSVSGGTGAAKFSLSRGHIPSHYGMPIKMERLLLSTQSLANELAGNVLEKANLPYRYTFNNLLYNNRLVDICPRQFITATIEAADNLRGISYSGNAIVKHIDLNFTDGAWDISWEAEPETKSVLSVNGDIPTNPGEAPWVPSQWPPVVQPKLPEIVIPPDPVVITPLGIVAVLLSGYGIWAMDTIKAPGVWYNVTTPFDWTLAELAIIKDFVLSPMGTAYIVGEDNPLTIVNLWSQTVGSVTSRILIADTTYFSSNSIAAIGFKPGTADQLAVVSSHTGSILGGNALFTHKLATGGLSLTPVATIGNGYDNSAGITGNITNYLDKWYSSMYEWGGDHVFRLNDNLTAIDGTRLDFGWPGISPWHCQASQADIMYVCARNLYSVQPSTLTVINNITDGHSTSFPGYSIACDPTGLFVFSCADIVRKSSDSGVTWTTITNFPSLSYDGSYGTLNTPRVYNLGDANKWLVAYNMTVHMEPGGVDDRVNRLHIWYTTDFGSTWNDWASGLVVNGIVAENSVVQSIQNA